MNENCNGILRRFIPKGTDLNKISTEKLEKILKNINVYWILLLLNFEWTDKIQVTKSFEKSLKFFNNII